MVPPCRLLFASALTGAVLSHESAVTPVQKVTELLKKLSAQISDEAAAEAKMYDKYACFCKQQADDRLYAIEKSQERIKMLTAKIEKLDSDLDILGTELHELNGKIDATTTDIETKSAARAAAHAKYEENAKDMSDAIDATERAIKSLKDAKGSFEGNAKTNAFVQAKAQALHLLEVMKPGEAHSSNFNSNKIIGTLEELRLQFIERKNELNKVEFDEKSLFESQLVNLENAKRFAEQAKAEKEAQSAEKTETKAQDTKDKTEEASMKEADDKFMGVLTEKCEVTAKQYDQRTQQRKDELAAIAEALDKLQNGVSPNYDANEKLTGLASKSIKVHQAPSFLQERSKSNGARVSKALQLLSRAASKEQSSVLASVFLKAKASADHFVKVRGLIKDIIDRMQAEADAEKDTKDYCDKNMALEITARDEATSALESTRAHISETQSNMNEMKSEIATLSEEVARNLKDKKEAQKLRGEEKAKNEVTIEKSKAGQEAVQLALEVLQEFYEHAALLQQKQKFVPTNSGRDGKTVDDVAPEIFDGTETAKKTESKGIIGMLEVILSDFERTTKATADEEGYAEEDHDYEMDDLNSERESAEGRISDLEGEVKTAEEALLTAQDDEKDQVKAKGIAEDNLKKLQKMCVDGDGGNYEDRVAQRKKEIAALKDAMSILDNWKN